MVQRRRRPGGHSALFQLAREGGGGLCRKSTLAVLSARSLLRGPRRVLRARLEQQKKQEKEKVEKEISRLQVKS